MSPTDAEPSRPITEPSKPLAPLPQGGARDVDRELLIDLAVRFGVRVYNVDDHGAMRVLEAPGEKK